MVEVLTLNKNPDYSEGYNPVLQKNLSELMSRRRVNMSDISRATGVPITTIQRLYRDPKANPTIASLKPIADFFRVSIGQLIGENPLPEEQETHMNGTVNILKIPIINWDNVLNNLSNLREINIVSYIKTDLHCSNNSFALKITQNNFEDFPKGAVIIVDPSLKPEHRDYVLSFKKDGKQPELKQLLFYDGDQYLKPLNPEFQTCLLDKNYQLLGVIIQTRMDYKG